MPDPTPKFPGEKTVPIRVPERLAYCLEQQVIPALLANPERGVYGDMRVGDLSDVRFYKLHGRPVVRVEDLKTKFSHIVYPSQRFYETRTECKEESIYLENSGIIT